MLGTPGGGEEREAAGLHPQIRGDGGQPAHQEDHKVPRVDNRE